MKTILAWVTEATNTVKGWFANPKVRLASRALIAAGGAFYLGVSGNLTVDEATVQAAITAAAWAALETITPLNGVVGFFQQTK
jgi:hypothetical protein